jgi:hypothetical protein
MVQASVTINAAKVVKRMRFLFMDIVVGRIDNPTYQSMREFCETGAIIA